MTIMVPMGRKNKMADDNSKGNVIKGLLEKRQRKYQSHKLKK